MQQWDNHNKNWGASDFERYYSGKMNKEEMYALENDALNDAFLQDALEGYKHTQSAIDDIEEIKKKLAQKKQSKLVPIEWYRQKKAKDFLKIAATVFLFISLGWLFYNNKEEVQSKSTTELAQLKTEPGQEQNVPETETTSIADSTVSLPETNTQKTNGKSSLAENKAAENNAGTTVTRVEDDAADNFSQKITATINETAKKETKVNEHLKQSPMPGLSADKNYSGAVNNMHQHIFSGSVKDQAGQPVPNAIVYDTKTRNTVQTNAYGQFNIQAIDTAMSIAVNAMGYEQATQSINSNDMLANNIVLQKADQQLSEVVVTLANAKVKKSSNSLNIVKIRGASSLKTNGEPMYVVNNQVLPASDFMQIPSGFIKSMQVIKDKNAAAIYGSMATNGIVVVTLKENLSLHKPATVTLINVAIISGETALRQFAKDSLFVVSNKKTIELKFDTDDSGIPVRIAVKNSICSSCDNKAIQMLNLATWQKVKKGKKAGVKLNF